MTNACRLAGLSRTAWYRPQRAGEQRARRARIREIACTRPRVGANRICVLLRREGWHVNRKRVWRLYRLERFAAVELCAMVCRERAYHMRLQSDEHF